MVIVLGVIAIELAWFLFVGPPPQTSANAAEQVRHYWEWVWAAGFWTAFFTGWLTVSTVALWWTTRDTLRHAREDSGRQARDMQKSLGIAKQAADAATAGNRAWLKVSTRIGSTYIVFGKDHISVIADIAVENVGNSPATRVRVSCGTGGRADGSENLDGLKNAVNRAEITFSERITYDIGRSPEEIAQQKAIGGVVFPGEDRPIGVYKSWDISRDELRGIVSEESALIEIYVAISSEYRTENMWGVTTVVYAVEKVSVARGESFRLWDSSEVNLTRKSASLRMLNLYTTAK